jgi:hypothetical protein
MPLVSSVLATAIEAADLASMAPAIPDPAALANIKKKANMYAAAIQAFIVSGTITTSVTATVPPGIAVVTAGSPSAQTGATTAPGTAVGTGTGVMA